MNVPYVYRPDDFFTLRATSASNLQIKISGRLSTYLTLHAKEFLVHTTRIQSQELFTFRMTSVPQPATKSMHDYDK